MKTKNLEFQNISLKNYGCLSKQPLTNHETKASAHVFDFFCCFHPFFLNFRLRIIDKKSLTEVSKILRF